MFVECIVFLERIRFVECVFLIVLGLVFIKVVLKFFFFFLKFK